MMNGPMFCSLISALLDYFIYSQFEPILGIRLLDYNFSQTTIGVYFAIFPVVYAICGLNLSKIPKSVNRQALMIFLTFLYMVSALLMGPSIVLNFPDNYYLLALGYFLGGCAAVNNIIALTETVRLANVYFPNDEKYNVNFCSGIFNSFLGTG